MIISKIKNRFLLNADYLRRKEFVRGLPNEVTIELTNNCNLQCIMCPRHKMKRNKGYMEFPLFKKIIDEISNYTEVVDLDMFGESFMHPQIFDMIKYCKLKGLDTILHTNMTLVESEISNKLVDSGLDMVVISIDGITEKTYESIRIGADFEKVILNTNTFLRLKKKKPYAIVQMIYMTRNSGEVSEFISFWRNKKVDFVRIRPYENIDHEIIYLNALGFKKLVKSRPCIQLWRKMFVCWDGTVVPCCDDYDNISVLGDAKKDSLRKIWNNESYSILRKKHIMNERIDIPLCKSCFPFKAHSILVAGSIFLNPYRLRKYLYLLEKLLIFKKIRLINYF